MTRRPKDRPPFVSCGKCADGWTVKFVAWGSMTVPTMARCECWKTWDALKAASQRGRKQER
jgi:hypothetical protein